MRTSRWPAGEEGPLPSRGWWPRDRAQSRTVHTPQTPSLPSGLQKPHRGSWGHVPARAGSTSPGHAPGWPRTRGPPRASLPASHAVWGAPTHPVCLGAGPASTHRLRPDSRRGPRHRGIAAREGPACRPGAPQWPRAGVLVPGLRSPSRSARPWAGTLHVHGPAVPGPCVIAEGL